MRGDHIYVERFLLGMPIKAASYTHHGIDLGDGRVVHYSGEPGRVRDAKVEISTLDSFLDGGKKKCVRYKRCETFSNDEIVARALARVGENGYNVALNNCEHFARWCMTGQARSRQVERVARGVAKALRSVFRVRK